jgi:hypothetical protein
VVGDVCRASYAVREDRGPGGLNGSTMDLVEVGYFGARNDALTVRRVGAL